MTDFSEFLSKIQKQIEISQSDKVFNKQIVDYKNTALKNSENEQNLMDDGKCIPEALEIKKINHEDDNEIPKDI